MIFIYCNWFSQPVAVVGTGTEIGKRQLYTQGETIHKTTQKHRIHKTEDKHTKQGEKHKKEYLIWHCLL
jgi:hypothetical protein